MMKIKKVLIVFVFLFLGIVSIYADVSVAGIVKDEKGEFLIGVSVKIKGTMKGTVTDVNGKFVINVPGINPILTFSYLGYESLEVRLGSQNFLNIIMTPNLKDLDEVVVVGYQELKKRDLTGSVGKADLSNMLKMNVSNIDQALSGRVAGVQVTSNEGTPGAEMNIVVRGTNSITGSNAPLYVIDGFPMEDGSASTINPRDIESMEVLKDASATAIYGARGANGVVMITTKKGQIGAPVVTYDGSFGMQRVTKQMPVLDAYNFVKMLDDVSYSTSMNGGYYATDVNGKKWTLEDYKDVPAINWQNLIFRDAPVQNHSLMISGGKEDSRYTASLSYFNQDGIIINTTYNRIQGKISNTIKKKDLTIYLNANYSRATQFGARPSENSWASANNLFSNVWGFRPAIYPTQSLDSYLTDIFDESIISDYRVNPVVSLNNEYRKTFRNVLQTNGYLQYEFVKGLLLKASMGFTNEDLLDEAYNNSNTRFGNITNANRVNATEATSTRQTWLNENTLTYTKLINKKHNVNALLGYTMQASDIKAYSTQTIQIPSESETLGMAGMGSGTPFLMNSTVSRWTMMSYLGRLNYNYRNRYYATASFRADGSSRFKGDNQFGYFPSGSLAWNFTEENFMKPISEIVSSGKFRLSWGVTGNNRVGDYDTYSRLTRTNANGVYPFDNSLSSVGVVPSTLSNIGLRWESTSQWNLGTDISLLNQRLFLTLDIYKKNTDDLLLYADLPFSSGYTNGYKNIGKTENKGLEITLKTWNIKTKNFTWSTNFNISFNQNKVLALTENQTTLTKNAAFDQAFNSMPNYYTQIGYPLGLMYGYIYQGTYKYNDFNFDAVANTYTIKPGVPTFVGEVAAQPGFPKYRDLNGDGKIDSNDQTVIGRGTPIHIGGFINEFTYKGFDLSVFFQWSYGNDVLSANILKYQTYNGSTLTNLFSSWENHWSPENPNSDIPANYLPNPAVGTNKISYFKASLNVFSTRAIQDGSFLRLKNITLGYNLDSKILKSLKLNKVRLFVNANDIFVLTSYNGGYDPEVSVRNSALTPGFDFSAYPRALSLNGGVTISF